MKLYLAIAFLVLTMPCVTAGGQTKSDQAPSGTVIDKEHPNNSEVQPAPEKIQLTPELIRSAQGRLNQEGYKSGTPDGKMGPVTREAIGKYQQDKGAQSDWHTGREYALAFECRRRKGYGHGTRRHRTRSEGGGS